MPSTDSEHFHVWEFRSSWHFWKCQSCDAQVSSEAVHFLDGGPFEAAKMSREELEHLERKMRAFHQLGRLA